MVDARVLIPILLLALPARASRLVTEGVGFLQKTAAPVAGAEARVEVQYDRDRRPTRFLTFKFHPVVRATSAPGAWENQAVFDPREIALERERAGFHVKAGFFTPKWEGTDGVNPMDIASMKDYADPLRAQTKASLGLHVGSSGEVFETEFFYVPKQTRSSMPGYRSPWYPRRIGFPLRDETTELTLPDGVEYIMGDRDELDKALGHNAGFRVQARGDLGDVAVAAFEGAADAPILVPVLSVGTLVSAGPPQIIAMPGEVTLNFIDYRRRTGAIYGSFAAGSFLFRAAFRHDQPLGDDRRLPGWSQQGVFGFEKSFAVGEDQVTLILQSAWGRRRSDTQGALSISDLFDRAGLWGLRWPVGESWSFLASGFYSFRDGSRMSQLEVSRTLSDEWTSEFFVQALDGPPESLPGILADRDRAGLRLIRSF